MSEDLEGPSSGSEPDSLLEPASTGVRPEQIAPTPEQIDALVRLPEAPFASAGIQPVSLTATLGRLGDVGISGIAANMLLQVSTAHMETELRRVRGELREASDRAGHLKDQLHAERQERVLADERLRVAQSERSTTAILTTLGGLILGVAAQTSTWTRWNTLGVLLGVSMLIVGWFVVGHRKN